MKSVYTIPVLICALGIGLMVAGTTGDAGMSILGFPVMPLLVKRLGLIVLILSMIGFLAAYGSTLPPLRTAQRDTRRHAGEASGKGEELPRSQQLSHRA